MSSQGNSVLLFTLIHFTLGRSFSVLFAILNQMPVFLYFPLALAYDYVHNTRLWDHPGTLKQTIFPCPVIQKKADRVLTYMNESLFSEKYWPWEMLA